MEKQMEAERQKRAAITISTGQKEAKIAVSEGERIEAVNLSEGEKQKRINEAEGRAKEIGLLAEATASGLAMVAEAIRSPGGEQATKMQLAEQYLNELGRILEHADTKVVPVQIGQVKAFFEGINQVGATLGDTGGGAGGHGQGGQR
jgi:regulator of protease activity HflC (stomatin/prohibitin superfamily)